MLRRGSFTNYKLKKFFESERESGREVGAEREGERIPSRFYIVSAEPDKGLELTMT